MRLIQNFPFFCILLTLIGTVVSSVLSGKNARRMSLAILGVDWMLNAFTLADVLRTGESFAFRMGHFAAPWGNEIRVGVAEALAAQVLLTVILLSVLAGMRRSIAGVEKSKSALFCILCDLATLAMLALVYTNDLFTAYVFIEINTLAAAGLTMARQNGRSLVGGTRYLIMNLIGSSMFLLGVVLLYIITGQLLMVPLRETLATLDLNGQYRVPLLMALLLITLGLGMKSGLYPFEKWLPGAYPNALPTASALLSGVISKSYIFLLIKIYTRVIGFDLVRQTGILNVILVMGCAGMIMGSVKAVRSRTTRMMTAYSSIAQIGYIYMALGLGNELGMLAALWHLLAHSMTKSMLFLSGSVLDEASGGTHKRSDLRGAFYRSPLAAVCFAVGGANLVGVPLLSVFITKVTMAEAAIACGGGRLALTLAAMVVSTLLNAAYFLGTASSFFSPREGVKEQRVKGSRLTCAALVVLLAVNVIFGLMSQTLLPVLRTALQAIV